MKREKNARTPYRQNKQRWPLLVLTVRRTSTFYRRTYIMRLMKTVSNLKYPVPRVVTQFDPLGEGGWVRT